ncbi:MAG TPA: lysine 6-monooxygenase, partial [Mycobacterium sp.]|nr:lysine 6-monooxygenase [Mycobacterium sp.]
DPDAARTLSAGLGGPPTRERLEESIGHDLAVADVAPKLFLPNLAGLNEGPGFPNLSCLGRLSDRVLGADIGRVGHSTRRTVEYQSV